MGVDLCLESETGERLASLHDPRNYVMYLVELASTRETVCLRFIDPYGDTVFNSLQAPVLIRELEETRNLITESRVTERARQAYGPEWQKEAQLRAFTASEIRAHLEGILELAARAVSEGYLYLKFYGD
jgi:hypothetical protein